MASIYQNKKTKTWEFVFWYYPSDTESGKQIRRKGFKTKKEANEMMIDLQSELRNGKFVKVNHHTVGGFIKHWLESEKKMNCSETTHYNNQLYFKNHIEPKLGDVKLQKLTPIICQEFVYQMHHQGYAFNTIDRVCTIIKQALDKAVIYKYMKENHMRKVSMPSRQKREMIIWTTEQTNHFLNSTKNKRFYCVYALALFTGMRQGEILGLRWNDIDFEKKTITVSQTLTHYGKSLKNGAKTRAGERTISISSQLIDVLKKQRKAYLELKLMLGQEFQDIDIVIFNFKNGKTIFPANLTRTYAKDVKAAGLPHIPFHNMRHTHATMLIEKNINVKVISERLGHSKIGITLDTYSHVLPSMQQAVADKLDEIITL